MWHAESPELSLRPDAGTLDSFKCVGCGVLAVPPAVLTCGHVVHARPGGWPSCPIQECTGSSTTMGSVAVCGLIASVLRSELDSAEYNRRLSITCGASVCEPQGETPTEAEVASLETESDPRALVGVEVELHSLTSEAGRTLNGRVGIVSDLIEESGRLLVRLHRSIEDDRTDPIEDRMVGFPLSPAYAQRPRSIRPSHP